MSDTHKHPGHPIGLPTCEHGNRPGVYSHCKDCAARDKVIREAVKPLVDEFWEHRGQRDLSHLMHRAYRMGREEFRVAAQSMKEAPSE